MLPAEPLHVGQCAAKPLRPVRPCASCLASCRGTRRCPRALEPTRLRISFILPRHVPRSTRTVVPMQTGTGQARRQPAPRHRSKHRRAPDESDTNLRPRTPRPRQTCTEAHPPQPGPVRPRRAPQATPTPAGRDGKNRRATHTDSSPAGTSKANPQLTPTRAPTAKRHGSRGQGEYQHQAT